MTANTAFCFSPECQQSIIDVGGLRSMHPQTKEKPGRTAFKEKRAPMFRGA